MGPMCWNLKPKNQERVHIASLSLFAHYFFIHFSVLSDTIASQYYKLQGLQLTLTRNRMHLIGFLLIFAREIECINLIRFLLIFAGRFGFGKFFSFIKIESHYQGSMMVTLQIQSFCKVWETKVKIQVFKREFLTYIHLDWTTVNFLIL